MKKLTWMLLLSCTGLLLAALPGHAGRLMGHIPGRVVLIMEPGAEPRPVSTAKGLASGLPSLDRTAERFGVHAMDRLYGWVADSPRKIAGEDELLRHWLVEFDTARDAEEVARAYAALPEVAQAFTDDIFAMDDMPNDPQLTAQYYLRTPTSGGKDIRALGGWAETHGDSNIVIAIVDSGVDWMHPDLGGSGPDYVNGAVWTNWTEYNGTAGVDDDGNGKVDDIRGWDFVTGVTGWPDEDDQTPDNDPMDYGSHGTACSGCSAAITDNGVGIAGASWGCKVMPVRVGWLPDGEASGVVGTVFCSQGMIYAAQNGANIINCSWGSSSYLETAVSVCQSNDVIVITSAGNDNDEEADYLSTHPWVISVAATDQVDGKADFSSYGDWVEISAPGVSITTTWWDQNTSSHTYNSVDGTSFSSPITCGAAALIWSSYPGFSASLIKTILLGSADDLDALNPSYAGKLGTGRVNLLRALGDSFLEVPDELPTLFDAMNVAAPGDTIAVPATTVLTGPLTILAKEMHLLGGWDAGYTTRDPLGTPTTIQGTAGGAALLFATGTGAETVVDGFRCTGGGGLLFSYIPVSGRFGGGVILNHTSPTLRNLEITGNSVGNSTQVGGGGGLLLFDSQSVCENLVVHGNTAVLGGGVYVFYGSPTLRGCRIYGNTLIGDNFSTPAKGGGVFALNADLTLEDCEIDGHSGAVQGGGLYLGRDGDPAAYTLLGCDIHDNDANDAGSGLYVNADTATLRGGSVSDNVIGEGAMLMRGGGLKLLNAAAVIDSVHFVGNAAVQGGGVDIESPASLQLTNSVFTGNSAFISGGAVNLFAAATGAAAGNTLVANTCSSGGAAFFLNASPLSLTNNLIAFNTGGSSYGNAVAVSGAAPTLGCNDAWGNDGAAYSGVADPTGTGGNIAADPVLCDLAGGNLNVDEISPCHPANSGGCGLIGALADYCQSTGVGDGDTPDARPLAFRVEPAFPNPFNPSTTIRFSIPHAGRTRVVVFDLAGRVVRTLVDEDLAAAAHAVEWRGLDAGGRQVASGVYFYRVSSGDHAFTGRLALIR